MLRHSAALAAVLCCATTTPALAAEPRPQSAARPVQARQPVGLVLTKVSPKSAGPTSRVELAGTVDNRSGQQLAGLSVRLRYGSRPLTSRGEVERYAAGAAAELPGAMAAQPLPQTAATGGRQNWRLTGTTKAMGMRTFGVYPVTVEVLNAARLPVVKQTTFITYVPAGPARTFRKTSIAWIWPMIDRPRRSSDTTFVDDRLETDLGPNGRLGGLVAAAKGHRTPITWAVDPALLDDARAMTAADGYALKPIRGGKPARRPRSATAKTWLSELRTASGKSPFFATPYGDVDGVALVRNRMAGHLKVAYRDSSLVSSKDLLGRAPTSSIGWPVAGAADQPTLDRMAAYGSDTFLMSSDLLLPDNQNVTADATTTLQTSKGIKPTVVFDAGLSEIVSRDTRAPGAGVLAEQRFLAETAMITSELPNQPRTVVVAPNRRWNPAPGLAKKFLDYTAAAPWMAEVPLDKITRARPQPRTFIGYQPTYERYELGPAYLKEVRKIAGRASTFGSILNPPGTPYRQAVLRTESSAWRGQSTTAHRTREAVNGELTAESSKVRVVASRRYSLAGSSGRLLVTVANDLPDRAVDVQVNVVSRQQGLLRVANRAPDRFPKRLIIEPQKKQTLVIPVQFAANGDATVALELLTPEGRQFGAVRTIQVRTTAYGKTAILITGSALAVLFVGVGVRATRARRRRKAQPPAPGGGPSTGGRPVELADTGLAPGGPIGDTIGGPAADVEPASGGPAGGGQSGSDGGMSGTTGNATETGGVTTTGGSEDESGGLR